MKLSKNTKGFTLVEILIVVVIIGILAALILPRLMSQPEKAIIAEGVQFLGAIRRAQQNYADTVGNGAFLTIDVNTAQTTTEQWRTLGFRGLATTSRFAYACDPTAGTAFCTATRLEPGGTYDASVVQIDLADGSFTCTGKYELAKGTPQQCIPVT